MAQIEVNGGRRLDGTVSVQGAKNSILPILAATFLCDGVSELHRCPHLSDVTNSLEILSGLGCRCTQSGDVITVDATSACDCCISENLMLKMRSSIVFLGAVLGRCGSAVISSPGGCELGPRPIDLHLSALRAMGAEIQEEHGFLRCTTPNGLHGCNLDLSFPSVGATENVMLAATLAEGKTVLHNAAREPEIVDLAAFLNAAGARIGGAGQSTVTIEGVLRLGGSKHTIIPDRIVAMTYLCAAAATGGKITLTDVRPDHMNPMLSALKQTGCELTVQDQTVILCAPERISRLPLTRTLVYPGFPTDAGPMLIALLTRADGTSVFVENIFENRYRYVDELNRMGTHIKIEGKVAVIEGVDRLTGANCACTDLRGGAALVVAALSANGKTQLDHIAHLLRGYEHLPENLASLGAEIRIK